LTNGLHSEDFDAGFIGLTGSPDAIKSLAKSYRFYYRPTHTSASGDYLVDHSTFLYLIGPDGRFITNFGRNASAEECAEYISKLAQ
jgi:cytochrome oxidase Cu insertion factor (SCO1/SenC/PrrC family)